MSDRSLDRLLPAGLHHGVQQFVFHTLDAVILTDAALNAPGPRILYVNPAFTRMTGYTAEQAVGRNPRMLQSPRTCRATLDKIRRALEAQEPVQAVVLNIWADGTQHWIDLSITPLLDEQGVCTHFLGIQRDATQRMQAMAALETAEAKYRSVVNEQTDLICRWKPDTTLTLVNDAYARFFQQLPEDLIETPFRDLIPESEWPAVKGSIQRLLETGEPLEYTHRVLRPQGATAWVHWVNLPLLNDMGEVVEVQSVGKDVTAEMEARRALDRSNLRFSQLFEHSPIGLAIADGGTLLSVNTAFARMLGYRADQLAGTSVERITHPSDWQRELELHGFGLQAGGPQSHRFTKRYVHADGHLVHAELTTFLVPHTADEQQLVAAFVRDVSAEAAAKAEIERLAFTDSLTGMANRAVFTRLLSLAVDRMQRDSQSRFSVAFIDLDNFKTINDTYGHSEGDALLQVLAQRMTQIKRRSDTFARIGGDEFALLLLDTDPAQAVHEADRIRRCICEPVTLSVSSEPQEVSVSVGLVCPNGSTSTAEDFLRFADIAMYQAKKAGGNRVVVFHQDMNAAVREHNMFERSLRRALYSGGLVLAYQPILRLSDRRLVAFEALVRWNHPNRGLLLPGEFLGQAVDLGLMSDLYDFVLRTALGQLTAWQTIRPSVAVSVNVSPAVLTPDASERTLDLIREAAIAPDTLHLELTEQCLASPGDQRTNALRRLREHGVHLHLDDFGVGCAALSLLHDLPIHALKLDRSFVARMTHSPQSLALVRSVVELARVFGLETVAEGIETEQQYELLRDVGFGLGQGFHLGRPMTAEQANSLINSAEA